MAFHQQIALLLELANGGNAILDCIRSILKEWERPVFRNSSVKQEKGRGIPDLGMS